MADDRFAAFYAGTYRRLLGQLFAVTGALRALALGQRQDASAKPRCMDGVDAVLEEQALLKPALVGKRWLTTSDVTVLLRPGTSDAEREAVRTRLEAIDGVATVAYESPAQMFRLLPEKFRDDSSLLPRLTPSSVPACFRVTLRDPTRVEAFHRALCGSRRTGDCPGGVVVLVHARR